VCVCACVRVHACVCMYVCVCVCVCVLMCLYMYVYIQYICAIVEQEQSKHTSAFAHEAESRKERTTGLSCIPAKPQRPTGGIYGNAVRRIYICVSELCSFMSSC